MEFFLKAAKHVVGCVGLNWINQQMVWTNWFPVQKPKKKCILKFYKDAKRLSFSAGQRQQKEIDR
jgi:hypothetical protein